VSYDYRGAEAFADLAEHSAEFEEIVCDKTKNSKLLKDLAVALRSLIKHAKEVERLNAAENKTAARGLFGRVKIGPGGDTENLAVILCRYFSAHSNCPEDDERTEQGWHPWVEEMADTALDEIVEQTGYCQKQGGRR